MSLSTAWVLFGAIMMGTGIIADSQGAPLFGFLIALTATILSKSSGWYFWKKKD